MEGFEVAEVLKFDSGVGSATLLGTMRASPLTNHGEGFCVRGLNGTTTTTSCNEAMGGSACAEGRGWKS